MQTVDKTMIPTADDGQPMPTENGETGENGSAAESREDTRRAWQEIIDSPRFHALYTEQVSEIVRKRLRGEGESTRVLGEAASLLGVAKASEVPERIRELLTPATRDWQSEEAAVQEKYPEFLLERELRDPAFTKLLEGFSNAPAVTLTKLYELFHLERLTGSAAAKAAEQTANELMGAVRLRHARPHENGLDGAQTSRGNTASRLTRAERAILAGRAAKGEKISF